MAKIDRMMVGESLVGDGNEVAHIDQIEERRVGKSVDRKSVV